MPFACYVSSETAPKARHHGFQPATVSRASLFAGTPRTRTWKHSATPDRGGQLPSILWPGPGLAFVRRACPGDDTRLFGGRKFGGHRQQQAAGDPHALEARLSQGLYGDAAPRRSETAGARPHSRGLDGFRSRRDRRRMSKVAWPRLRDSATGVVDLLGRDDLLDELQNLGIAHRQNVRLQSGRSVFDRASLRAETATGPTLVHSRPGYQPYRRPLLPGPRIGLAVAVPPANALETVSADHRTMRRCVFMPSLRLVPPAEANLAELRCTGERRTCSTPSRSFVGANHHQALCRPTDSRETIYGRRSSEAASLILRGGFWAHLPSPVSPEPAASSFAPPVRAVRERCTTGGALEATGACCPVVAPRRRNLDGRVGEGFDTEDGQARSPAEGAARSRGVGARAG